jgi:hypothetical protein|tara:strand:+ start:221 stop:748 length:528 start_codon:yes stop_codon:yes gene_type:complete
MKNFSPKNQVYQISTTSLLMKKVFHDFQSLPPLEPSDIIKKRKHSKRLIFGFLGTIIIILATISIVLLSTSEPEPVTAPISITNVTFIASTNKCETHFILTNSGDIDGFAEVEMFGWAKIEVDDGFVEGEGRVPLDKGIFFVGANTTEEKNLQSERVPKFLCLFPKVVVEIIKIE